MARQSLMRRFARWHIWLGWAAAIPLLVWVISGLFMTLRPIEEVRGDELKRAAPPFAAEAMIAPQLTGPATRVILVSELGQPVWAVTGVDKVLRRFDARSGAPLGPVAVIEARQLAEAAFAGPAALTEIRQFSADQAPLDLRKPRPSWQASFADGTHIYIDADTGEVLALRTRFWRAYDFMWGLHIMDPRTREDTSNVFLWVFGAVALVSCVIGTTLLFRRRKARL